MLSLSAQPGAVSGHESLARRFVRWIRWRLPRTVGPHRILSGPLRGKTIVTSWRDYPAAIAGITEPQLLQWFRENVRPYDTWLDIGAHYGYTALALAGCVGGGGRVFAFEPMLTSAGCLERTRTLNRLQTLVVCPVALGTVDGVEFQTTTVVRGMADRTITGPLAGGEQIWTESIMVSSLDWLWSRICGKVAKIDGVKIDVQGMELEVLRGMQKLLTEHRPKLVIELHRGVDRTEVLSLLERLGYSGAATPIEPVAGEVEARLLDDRSYAFSPKNAVR
jgi:FkbM family methyltransferase